jgi:hypothetical protein
MVHLFMVHQLIHIPIFNMGCGNPSFCECAYAGFFEESSEPFDEVSSCGSRKAGQQPQVGRISGLKRRNRTGEASCSIETQDWSKGLL